MIDKITFCIPSKNNVRYLKTCLPSIRKNAFRNDHDIIVFVDSDNDGTVEWLKENAEKYNVTYYINPDLGNKLFGIGKAYDFCIENSKTDVCMIFHADMMLGKDADLKAFELLKPKSVVCSTRIEPPLHPNAGEKILQDFGVWPEDFKENEFNQFVETTKQQYKGRTTTGIFAPWMIKKEDLLELGGHDPMFHSAREDSDLFNRMKLAGYELIQSWESLVYHLTGRGGQFQHGTVTKEEQAKSEEWQRLMNNSTKEFFRKWGTGVNHTPMMDPIIAPKYDIGFRVINCNVNMLSTLELFCSTISSDASYAQWLEEEQKNTSFDMWKRIKPWNAGLDNDIIVEFDVSKLNQQNFTLLQQLPLIIQESGEIGEFELDIFKIKIKSLKTYEKDLIFIRN